MDVVLTADQSTNLNKAVVNLVSTDVEKAKEFLMMAGYDEAGAEATIEGIKTSIDVAEAQELLVSYRSDLQTAIFDLVSTSTELNPVDDVIEFVECKVMFDRGEKPGEPGVMIGWVVTNPKTRVKGEKRASSTRSSSGGGGNGRRSRVPCPEGIKSWQAHLVDTYPQVVAEKTGSYSAPRVLESLDDPVYLAAKGNAPAEATEPEAAVEE